MLEEKRYGTFKICRYGKKDEVIGKFSVYLNINGRPKIHECELDPGSGVKELIEEAMGDAKGNVLSSGATYHPGGGPEGGYEWAIGVDVTEDSRSKKSEELVAEALGAKQRYVTLHTVISDGDLKTHMERYGPDAEKLLTLGNALLFDRFNGLATQILRSLEANLAHFRPKLDKKKRKHLAHNLLNGRDQFLNTLSELGLARKLTMEGRVIDLAQPFHDGSRDVDIADSTRGSERLIEVVNLAPKEASVNGFAPVVSEEVQRLVTTVTGKYQSKFGKAIAEGWDGPMWIALDIIKNDMAAISATLEPLREPDFLSRFARAVLRNCPKLRGVLYYTHYAYEESAFWVKEFHR